MTYILWSSDVKPGFSLRDSILGVKGSFILIQRIVLLEVKTTAKILVILAF